MKNLFLIPIMLFIFSASVAQTKIGIKAGATFSDLTGRDATGSIHNKTGFYSGVLFNIPATHHFHIQPELLWSNEGYKYTDLSPQIKTTLSYINLLALGQYVSNGFHVETGPQLGLLMSAKRKGGAIGTQDLKDVFKSTAFSWVAGFGYRDPYGYGIDLRYAFGLGNIPKDTNIKTRLNVFQAGISKTFKLAKKKK